MTLNSDQFGDIDFSASKPGIVHIGGKPMPAVTSGETEGFLGGGMRRIKSALVPLENGRLVHVSHTNHENETPKWFVSAPDSVEVDERVGTHGYTTRMGQGTSGYFGSAEEVHARLKEVSALPSPGLEEQKRNQHAIKRMRSEPEGFWAQGAPRWGGASSVRGLQ